MATLPYSVSVKRRTISEFDVIQNWCRTQWPHTHQMTWQSGWVVQPLTSRDMYTMTWHFQREEDAHVFRITWT